MSSILRSICIICHRLLSELLSRELESLNCPLPAPVPAKLSLTELRIAGTVSRSSSLHQDGQGLIIGIFRPRPDLRLGARANRVVDHQERIVRQAQQAGNVLCRHLKRVGAKDDGAFSKLLEADAVMQTARRTRASVTQTGNQEVHLAGSLLQRLARRRRAGVRL